MTIVGPWLCINCDGRGCYSCDGSGFRLCTINATHGAALRILGPTTLGCDSCAALVRELDARHGTDVATAKQAPVPTMTELVKT